MCLQNNFLPETTLGAVPPHVQRSWLERLHTEWRALNSRLLRGRLRPPLIQLDQALTRLGAWEPLTRTIRISTEHLLADTWAEVLLTLRHEMAHQVVSELFASPAAPAHGDLFERACRMLDLDCSPRLERTRSSQERRALERIHKLLRLAQSPNPHEAQAAMAAANRLLLRYNLDRADLGTERPYAYRWLGRPLARIPLERKLLAGLLQDFFFVRAIWIQSAQAATGRPASLLEVVGEPHNLDVAEYAHDFLDDALDRLWRDYRHTFAGGRRARHDYRVGVLMGFREQLASQQVECKEEGLVWLGDPALDEVYERLHPRRSSLRGGHYRPNDAHEAGREEGRRIKLRTALSEPARDRGRLLE